MMRKIRMVFGFFVLTGIVCLIVAKPLPFLFYPDLPYVAFIGRGVYILILSAALCFWRLVCGPTAADRINATDILGILIVGFCALITIPTHRSWYIDIGIAWALQSFISTLALSKYLEGKGFDE
jgi:multicomponent Na+:H+ antiporter subunit F